MVIVQYNTTVVGPNGKQNHKTVVEAGCTRTAQIAYRSMSIESGTFDVQSTDRFIVSDASTKEWVGWV